MGGLIYDNVPRWIDAHSITCHVCGEFADEREALALGDDQGSICKNCLEKRVDDDM